MRKVFMGGNWKSNGNLKFIKQYKEDVLSLLNFDSSKCDVVIAPVMLHIDALKVHSRDYSVQVAAQNVSAYPEGAYTGEVTASQLLDSKVNWALVGHSERRKLFNETDELVSKKVKISQDTGLKVIACLGEQLDEREAGKTMSIVLNQLEAITKSVNNWNDIVIAYEPVWAIGTGKTASPEQAQEVHQELRKWLEKNVKNEVSEKVRIIYGGSVTEKNAKELITKKDIDGFLVGGASLKKGFVDIVDSYNNKFI